MKVLVFIDHDIICRHFINSGALSELTRRHDVTFVFPDDGGKRVKINPAALDLGAPFERVFIDPERQQTWRWQLFADQLKLRPGAHEAAIRRLRWQTLGWKAAGLLTLASLPGVKSVFDAKVRRRLNERPNRALPALIKRLSPDVILHPTVLEGVFVNDLIEAAADPGIPVVFCMNSWDNPSTKRAVVGKPDWLLVWGEQTREHAVRFMGMHRDRAVPFGAAQLDVHFGPARIDRAAYAQSVGLDPTHRLILFAGSNARTDEVATLEALDAAIGAGKLANARIVYRPHPWGGGGRDGARLASARFTNVVVDPSMRDYIAALGRGDPGITLPDYRNTHDLLSAVDAVISPMSTILFEAALHGKPAIVHAPPGEGGQDPLAGGLPMLHFEEFFALPDIRVTRDNSSLVREVTELLPQANATERGTRLRQASTRFLAQFDAPWRERIVTFLEMVARERSTSRPVAAEAQP